MIVGALLIAGTMISQNQEIEFDVYSTSAAKASRYLLADDVALRDCPSAQCEQLTTLKIGTYVRLLEKTDRPQTLNEVCSRWYKVKMGPQIGWIWGGLISQKTMTSAVDPEIKFLFGEVGDAGPSQKRYQIRAVKNGVELDKMVFSSLTLPPKAVRLDAPKDGKDLIRMTPDLSQDLIIVWEDGYFRQMTTANVSIVE